MLMGWGPTVAVLRTRTVPLSCDLVSLSCAVTVERATHVQLIVGSHAAGSCCGTERCAGDLIPGSQVGFEVELGIWDGVETRAKRRVRSKFNMKMEALLPIILRGGNIRCRRSLVRLARHEKA